MLNLLFDFFSFVLHLGSEKVVHDRANVIGRDHREEIDFADVLYDVFLQLIAVTQTDMPSFPDCYRLLCWLLYF